MSECGTKSGNIAERGALRNQRESNSRNRDTENSEGQLHQSKRDRQPRDGSFFQVRCKRAIHQHVHLHRAGGDDRRPHQHQDCAHARIARRPPLLEVFIPAKLTLIELEDLDQQLGDRVDDGLAVIVVELETRSAFDDRVI